MVGLVDLKWFHIQFRGDHEVVSGILQVLVDFFFINFYHRFYLFPVLIFADDLHAFRGIPLIPLLSWPCE